ncbi:MAG TPA: cellulase family glycosylhydrolase [Candidatus Limnocylindrales bacterium]|nr:cellulase family glycosylhydrolase [Candidatus Limnocylindrales bacterium]
MKTRLLMAGMAAATVVASLLVNVPAAHAAVGFRISGRNLVDVNGNVFIMRGTSHPHVWFQGETASFGELAGLGSNAVRVVLGSGQRNWGINSAADVTNVINLCKQNRLICMLEVHDTTGFGEQSGAASLDQAVTYWDSIRSALIGQENFILINIGNEPIGNNNPAQWTTATANAVSRMRTLGFQHTLVVDAPNWGQDWTNTMRNPTNAMAVWNADPQRNTLFSVHMYEVYPDPAPINAYFDAFAQMGLPLIVGEFGFGHNGQNVDEDTIMAEAQARGIGWLAWSYSGNSDGLLDQATAFNPAQLTTWGQRVFNGTNGVRATARCATVFTGCGPGGNPPAAPTGLTVTGTTANSASLSWTASTGATQYQIQRANGACSTSSSFSQVGTSTTTTFTNSGLTASTSYCYRVTASNANGTSGPSNTVTATTGPGGGGGCSVSPVVQSQWGDGYVTQPVTVTNTGTSATTRWTVTFTLPAGHAIVGSWNATLSGTTGTITATNAPYNGNLAPNANTNFGFQASRPNGSTQTAGGFTCAAS